MLVAIDASRAARSQKTGVEEYAWHIIEGLKTALPRQVQVILYVDAPTTAFGILPPHWTVRVLGWPPRRLWTQVRLAWAVWRDRPDVLFVPAHVLPHCLPRHTRTVTTIHDVAAARFPQGYNWFERWYSLFTARRALKCGRVLVPSQFTANELKNLFPTDATDQVVVVPHGLNTNFQTVPLPAQIASAQVAQGVTAPYLLAIGRLEHKKNTRSLVNAFTEFKKTTIGQAYQLVLVGKNGYGNEAVTEAIAASPYQSDIKQLGWVADDSTAALLAGAAALVFPSAYEGFGLPALEAAAFGVPVVTVAGHAVAEIGGAYFSYAASTSPADLVLAIECALNSNADQRRQVQALARSYTWRAAAQKTAAVLIS